MTEFPWDRKRRRRRALDLDLYWPQQVAASLAQTGPSPPDTVSELIEATGYGRDIWEQEPGPGVYSSPMTEDEVDQLEAELRAFIERKKHGKAH